MENISPKTIAQQYYLDEIVVHEVILESCNQLERELKTIPVPWDKNNIIYRLCNLSLNNQLCQIFNIDKRMIMNTIINDYTTEVEHLYNIGTH